MDDMKSKIAYMMKKIYKYTYTYYAISIKNHGVRDRNSYHSMQFFHLLNNSLFNSQVNPNPYVPMFHNIINMFCVEKRANISHRKSK